MHSYFHFKHTHRNTQINKNKHWILTCIIFLIFIPRPLKWLVTCFTCHETTIRTFQIVINSTGVHPHLTQDQHRPFHDIDDVLPYPTICHNAMLHTIPPIPSIWPRPPNPSTHHTHPSTQSNHAHPPPYNLLPTHPPSERKIKYISKWIHKLASKFSKTIHDSHEMHRIKLVYHN